jgi:O-succinylbenzoate synthase
MNVWYWRYELVPRRRLSAIATDAPRQGALIRIDDGIADVHPWPELGDAPLETQLAKLAGGQTTALTRRSLEMAKIDGAARERGVSLFVGLTIPESHWPGPDPPEGFDTVKLKSIERIPAGVRLRFDFNARLTPEQFLMIAEGLPGDRIDFVEDPCPYDGGTWSALRQATGLRLALDRFVAEEGVDVLVVKPAIQDIPDTNKELVITSYMDHPVGQFGAAYFAALHPSRRCGLFTHVLYEPEAFIEMIRSDGARLLPPEGTGVGFDDLLARLPWKKLA